MKIKSFNVDKVISITVTDKSKTHYKWLPRKQKTFLWFKINKFFEEGYYSYGCYEESYIDSVWDNTPLTEKELISDGYLVDNSTKTVYHKPTVTIYLHDDFKITTEFNTLEEATKYSELIQSTSTNTFITIKHESN